MTYADVYEKYSIEVCQDKNITQLHLALHLSPHVFSYYTFCTHLQQCFV